MKLQLLVIPALFTNASISSPKASTVAFTNLSQSSNLLTSACTAIASTPYYDLISSTKSSVNFLDESLL